MHHSLTGSIKIFYLNCCFIDLKQHQKLLYMADKRRSLLVNLWPIKQNKKKKEFEIFF